MQLTTSQKKSVEKILNAYDKKADHKIASFMAPTGSGKTFMASSFISNVFAKEMTSESKTIFVVATVSNAELPLQLSKKLIQYRNFHEFSDYKIEHIQSPSAKKKEKSVAELDLVLEDRKVFVFGVSSFGKNTLFYKNKTLDTFVQQANALNFKIIFIRDEAHIGKKETIDNEALENFDMKMNENSTFALHMTATPKSRENFIEMTPSDMEDDGFYLLKTQMKKTELINDVSNEEIIDDAISVFKKSKKNYQSLPNVIINPAMLVQVMNESAYEVDPIKNQEFHEGMNLLEKKLKDAGLKYLKYVSNKPIVVGANLPATLDYASRVDSEIDVIIFKVGPATGWDIPRANMLLQLRNVSSESLNVQTLGRIMRNPYPGLEKKVITDKYYVWSNYQKPTRDKTFYKLKEEFFGENFYAGKINQDSKIISENLSGYKKAVKDFITSKHFKNKLIDIDVENDIYYETVSYGSSFVKNRIKNHIYLRIYNLQKQRELEEKLLISLFIEDLRKISIDLSVDFEITKFIFFSMHSKLHEIKSDNHNWIHNEEPYHIDGLVKTITDYVLWKDNENPKKVKTKKFDNYGYKQLLEDENIQYLDSTPELMFYTKLENALSKNQKNKIKFISKMPTLGSKIYFEYYSKHQGKISKSYMDFAIKTDDIVIMVEVKSFDHDYNDEKTSELLDAYKMYMDKYKGENIALVLYQYDGASDTNYLHGYVDGKWEDDISMRDLFDHLIP